MDVFLVLRPNLHFCQILKLMTNDYLAKYEAKFEIFLLKTVEEKQ